MKIILKVVAIILAILGIAFLGGSYLAYLQGVESQIAVLAVVGIICLVASATSLIYRAVRFQKEMIERKINDGK